MVSVRVWILAVASGSFAAGVVVGFALPEMLASARPVESQEQQNVRKMAARYGLTAAQERSLGMVLQHDREQEIKILRRADWNQLPAELRRQRLAAQRRTEKRIRVLLDERQRALYDSDSKPDKK